MVLKTGRAEYYKVFRPIRYCGYKQVKIYENYDHFLLISNASVVTANDAIYPNSPHPYYWSNLLFSSDLLDPNPLFYRALSSISAFGNVYQRRPSQVSIFVFLMLNHLENWQEHMARSESL